jgi:hypothetical protein
MSTQPGRREHRVAGMRLAMRQHHPAQVPTGLAEEFLVAGEQPPDPRRVLG